MHNDAVLLRRGLPLALLSALLIAPPAWAAPQTISISDAADAAPVISGGPEPDVASVTVTQDGSTVSAAVNFHGPALASSSPRIYDVFFPLSVGTVRRITPSDPNSQSTCGTRASMNVRVVGTGSPIGDFTVSGAAGSLPFTNGPSFNADRTQLTWGMTHEALAPAMDCIETGPLYANIYSTVSHPDSYYNSACRCWLLTIKLDRLDGGDGILETTYWFPGKVPPPYVSGLLWSSALTEGKPVDYHAYALGTKGSSRVSTVKWFLGTTLVQATSAPVVVGAPDTVFTFVPPAPGTYRAELSHDGGVLKSTSFEVKADPTKPVPVPPTPEVTPISIGKKPPVIKGKPVVGKRLKIALGTLAQPNVTVKYQWYANGKKIKKAKRAAYTVLRKDAGKKLRVRLVASKFGTKSITYTTKAVKVKPAS